MAITDAAGSLAELRKHAGQVLAVLAGGESDEGSGQVIRAHVRPV